MSLVPLSVPTMSSASTGSPDMFGFAVGGSIQYKSAADRNAELDAIKAAGARWVRLDINWSTVQSSGPDSYDWSAHDAAIQAVRDRGLEVLAIIAYTPKWARSGGSDKYPPDDLADYASFAGEAAARYSAMGVHHYEVWNEPNISGFWRPAPDVERYTEMLKLAYAAIKSADPTATVLNGGFSPAVTGENISPRDFLAGIYAEGGGDSFDHLSHHPYNYPAFPGDEHSWSAWHQMCGTSPSLRSIMSDNGDAAKKIWGTEFGAPTDGPTSVSEATQGEMITRAYSIWKDYDWAGPLLVYQGRDLGTDTGDRENFFGLMRFDFSEKPSYAAYQAVAGGSFDDSVTGTCSGAGAGGTAEADDTGGEGSTPEPAGSLPSPPSPSLTHEASQPAKLEISRARVRNGRLVVRGSLDAAAAGERLAVRFRAAGRRIVLRPTVRPDGQFQASRNLRGPQRRAGAGRLVVRFSGNEVLRPAAQRLRAARRAVGLRFRRVRIEGNRLVVAGRIAPGARRQARIVVAFGGPNGAPAEISTRTRINQRGRFRARLRVPQSVRNLGASVSVAHPGRARLHGQRLNRAFGG